jgi:hypothetical protein
LSNSFSTQGSFSRATKWWTFIVCPTVI